MSEQSKHGITGRRIVRIVAENIKRLKAINIAPDGNMIVVSGRNGQGKSTALDCISIAVDGGEALKRIGDVIRKGEPEGMIEATIGDYTVRRRFRRTEDGIKSTVELTGRDGGVQKKPQAILDGLKGVLWHNPVEFMDMQPSEQVRVLLRAVGKADEADRIDGLRKSAFDARTDVNRRVRDLEGELRTLPMPPDGAPDTETDAAAILERINAANKSARAIEWARAEVASAEKCIRESEANIADYEKRLASERQTLETFRAMLSERSETLAALPPAPDAAAMQSQLSDIESANRQARAVKAYRVQRAKLDTAKAEADVLTQRMESLDAEKRMMLADVNLIPGVSFSEAGIAINGCALQDCSGAEQLKFACAVGMETDPELRVMLIKDGPRFDRDAMAAIEAMAEEKDFQVWVERIEDTGEGVIVIEDGEVQK